MKLNKFFMLGLAGLAFAACSNNDEAEEALSKGKKQVTVTITTGNFGTSRATDAWTENTKIEVNNAKIYFLDASNKIVETRSAKTGPNTFHNVATSVTKIAATANCSVPTEGNWDDVLKAALNVEDYQEAVNTPLSTQIGELVRSGSDPDDGFPLYTATIELSTTLSRIELKGTLTCEDLGEKVYSSLKLLCVGVNGANKKFTLDGVGSDPATDVSDKDGFPTANIPASFYDTAEVPTLTVAQNNGALATSYGYSVKGMPKAMLLKFDTEVLATAEGVTYDPAYLKIVGFRTTDNQEVTLEPGHIYQIEDLTFKEKDLTSLDDDKYICVTATVNVKDWEIVPVEPVYGE